MMTLFRLLLILSLSAAAPLNPNVKKEATEEDLVPDDISGVNGDGVVSDGIPNHTSQNTNRDAKHIYYGGNIKFSGTIDSTGNHAHINIGSISSNAAFQDHQPDSSQEIKPKPKPLDMDNSSPCSFNDGYLDPQELENGQQSTHDTRIFFKWEKNIIPYYYSDQNTKVADKDIIRSVMDTIESKTCFRFQEKTKEDYEEKHSLEIIIKPELCSGGVAGSVDTVIYKERLSLTLTAQVTNQYGDDCGYTGLILHELMHVLGVGHTQRRSDRDNYIRVNWENLKGTDETIKEQYRKCEDCSLYDGIDYDCDSIMHYGTHYNEKEVIEVINKDTCKLGSGPKWYDDKDGSSTDWKLLNIIGNCTVCTADQFSCLNGQQCIDMDFRCDGETECGDGSDEINCEKTDCTGGETNPAPCFCKSADGEKGEICKANQKCSTDGTCVVEKLWNDDGRCGRDHPLENGKPAQCDPTYGKAPCCSRSGYCGNEAEHCDCPTCINYAVCAADQFTCSSGDCIEQRKRCDGVLDCQDESDESKCTVSGEGVDIEFFIADEGEDHPSKREDHPSKRMGVYLITDQEIEGRPVYKQKEQKLAEQQFLFFSLAGHWTVGPNKKIAAEIGLRNVWRNEKMRNERTPPKNGWHYWDVELGKWISDSSIQIREVCGDDQFSCSSGECIYPEMRCDGDPDCLDESDEDKDMCQKIGCTGNQFFCSGKCIESNEKCDGFWDCVNGEDEINCQEKGYEKTWRDDLKCGKDNLLPNGKPATCDPIYGAPCCSKWGYCGISDEHCLCPTCINYRDGSKPVDECDSFPSSTLKPNPDTDSPSCMDFVKEKTDYGNGQLDAKLVIPLDEDINTYNIQLKTDVQVKELKFWEEASTSPSEGTTFKVTSPSWFSGLKAGAELKLGFKLIYSVSESVPKFISIVLNTEKICDDSGHSSTTECPTMPDLPPTNRGKGCSFNNDILAEKVLPSGQMSPHDIKDLFKWKRNKNYNYKRVIPYYFRNRKNTKASDIELVQEVMKTIEKKSCFKFVEKLGLGWSKKHSLEIRMNSKACTSGVSGYVDRRRAYSDGVDGVLLYLSAQVTHQNGKDCGFKGLILHELMHVLGVGHTQRRKDRDDFITVIDENLEGEGLVNKNQFKVCEKCTLYPNIGYDCDSVMHYGTVYNQKEVIVPKHDNCKLSEMAKMFKESGKDGSKMDWVLLNKIGKC